jgi:thiamine biosynthesis lipoprotein
MTFNFEAIGTSWSIDTNMPIPSAQIVSLIEQFDKNYSRFRTDSLVSHIRKKKGIYSLPPDAKPMFDLYKELYNLTDGKFTPLIGLTLEQAGYDSSYSLTPKALSAPPTWNEALDYTYPSLTVKKPILLDLGAAGKGYLVDLVGKLLENNNINEYTIDAGGDILHHSSVSLDIGLEHPSSPTKVIGVAKVSNNSICCSAGNRRRWANFHHIIDPHKLVSPQDILSVWIIADTALLADALATCLFLLPPKIFTSHYKFEYLILNSDFSIINSRDFPATLYTKV